jgi:hypothetical protein
MRRSKPPAASINPSKRGGCVSGNSLGDGDIPAKCLNIGKHDLIGDTKRPYEF